MKEYTYSVARVRAKETELLTGQDMDMLIAAEDYRAAVRLLHDKGYDSKENESPLKTAEDSLWGFLAEIVDQELLDYLKIPTDYYNVKAAVKAVFSDIPAEILLLDNGGSDKAVIYESVKSRDYGELPEPMAKTANEAMKQLLRTQDGQLCDIIIDKAMLDAQIEAAGKTGDRFIERYAELNADLANLRTALRCAKTEKTADFTEYALCDRANLNTTLMADAAARGLDAFYEYAESTQYSGLVPYMKKSAAEFERECDNMLMELMNEARYEPFTAAPIIAYAHAKRTELDAVRLILSAKRNGLDNDLIRERVRRLYV